MLQLSGVELYFDDVEKAKRFYREVVGLTVLEEQSGHYARFAGGPVFVCVERKGSESYPSQDKAVLFFHVASLSEAIGRIGRDRFADRRTRQQRASSLGSLPRSGRPQCAAD